MIKENIYTLVALTVIFALGCAIALESGNPEHWYSFISAFATTVIAVSTVIALIHWKKQERLKYKAQRAAEISLELSKPLWMLDLTLTRYEIRKVTHSNDNHEENFRTPLIETLESLQKKMHRSIAFKSPLIDQAFAEFCESWWFQMLGFHSETELLRFSGALHTSFKLAQNQLIAIAAIKRESFNTNGLMPEDHFPELI